MCGPESGPNKVRFRHRCRRRREATFGVGGTTDGEEDGLRVSSLTCSDVGSAERLAGKHSPKRRRGIYASCGQLNNCVPLKTVQLSPALAKLSSGCPPGPLKAVRKASGIICSPCYSSTIQQPGILDHTSMFVSMNSTAVSFLPDCLDVVESGGQLTCTISG